MATSDVSTYITHVTAQPEFTALSNYAEAWDVTVPYSVRNTIDPDSLYTAFPSDLQSYYLSVQEQVDSIYFRDTNLPAPASNAATKLTGGVVRAGIAAAGVVRVAVML